MINNCVKLYRQIQDAPSGEKAGSQRAGMEVMEVEWLFGEQN